MIPHRQTSADPGAHDAGHGAPLRQGVLYTTRSKWDHEQAVLGWIDSKAEWTDNFFNGINWDIIGRMDDKKHKQ